MLGILLAQWAIRTFVRLARTRCRAPPRLRSTDRSSAFTATVVIAGRRDLRPLAAASAANRGARPGGAQGDMRTREVAGGRRFGTGSWSIEIALAFTLLAGARLLVKNLLALQRARQGLPERAGRRVRPRAGGPRYADADGDRGFYRDLAPNCNDPGVVEAAAARAICRCSEFGNNREMRIEGGNPWAAKDGAAGRAIGGSAATTSRRWESATQGALVRPARSPGNTAGYRHHRERMAEKFWPGQNPIGKRFSRQRHQLIEVIGVVQGRTHVRSPGQTPYKMYRSLEQEPIGAMTVVLRTQDQDSSAAIQAARQIVATIDPLIPVASVQTLEQVVGARYGSRVCCRRSRACSARWLAFSP